MGKSLGRGLSSQAQVNLEGPPHMEPSMKSKGYLITFEGPEGSGKSTQIRFATHFLRKKGYPVLLLREPGGTPASEAIRKVLLNKRLKSMTPETELLLYMAARTQLVREKINPALKRGKIVMVDRFEDSTVAYQGFAGSIPLKTIEKLSQFVRGNLKPDLTILLDVETKVGLKRSGRSDRIEKKSIAFHEKVRRGFLASARREPKRFLVVPPPLSMEEVKEIIEKKLASLRGNILKQGRRGSSQ